MAPKVAGSKKFASTRSAKGAGKSQALADAKKLYAVDPSHSAVKWSARPYLDKRGSPFFGDFSSSTFLSEKHMMDNVISGGSSEWRNRLGYAISMGGSTIQGGATFVGQYCTAKEGESAADVQARAFRCSGHLGKPEETRRKPETEKPEGNQKTTDENRGKLSGWRTWGVRCPSRMGQHT